MDIEPTKLKIKLGETNKLSFAHSIRGTSTDPEVTKPISRFMVTESSTGFSVCFPMESDGPSMATVTIPIMPYFFSEGKEYHGTVEVIIGNKIFTPAKMRLIPEEALKINVEPVAVQVQQVKNPVEEEKEKQIPSTKVEEEEKRLQEQATKKEEDDEDSMYSDILFEKQKETETEDSAVSLLKSKKMKFQSEQAATAFSSKAQEVLFSEQKKKTNKTQENTINTREVSQATSSKPVQFLPNSPKKIENGKSQVVSPVALKLKSKLKNLLLEALED